MIAKLYDEQQSIAERIKNSKAWFMLHGSQDPKYEQAVSILLGLTLRYIEIHETIGSLKWTK